MDPSSRIGAGSASSPAVIADVEATVDALHVCFASVAELAVDLGIYLTFEHTRALVPLGRLLVPLQLLNLVRLALDNLFQVRDAAVAQLVLADQRLAAVRALDLNLWTVFHQVELDLLFCHLSGNSGDGALFRASVDLVARTIEFKMLYQISVAV